MALIQYIKSSFSIKQQLFAMMSLFALLPLFVVSYFTQNVMLNAGIRYISDNSMQIVQNGAEKTNSYFISLEQSLNEMVIDTSFQKMLSVGQTREAVDSLYINKVRELFSNIIINRREISAILLLDKTGHVYHLSLDPLKTFNFAYAFDQDSIYKQVFSMEKPQLISPHQVPYYVNNPSENIVSLVKPLKNFADYTISAWIVIELRQESVEQIVQQVPTEKTGSSFLYNTAEGSFIKGTEPPRDALEPLSHFMNNNATSSGGGELIIHGKQYRLAYQTLAIEPWRMVTLTPLNDLMQSVYLTRWTTLAIAILSFMLAFLFSVVFIKQLLKPLYALKLGMMSFSKGIVSRVATTATNELGFLVKTFNRMLDDHQQLERELLQTSIREKEKELLQLQAQVNPHFLFNTLGTIQTLALQGKKDEVEETIHCVSQMLRYNIRNDEGWTTLAEEISYIEYFQSIHYYRHEHPVEINFDIAPDCLSVPVIKLSLQPFVENALKYGWNTRPNSRHFHTNIAIREDMGFLHIMIRDNGPGFAPDTLPIIHELLKSDGEERHPFLPITPALAMCLDV